MVLGRKHSHSVPSSLVTGGARRNAKSRIDTGAEQIITTCPFCAVNLNAGAKLAGLDIKTIDLMQLVLESVGPVG